MTPSPETRSPERETWGERLWEAALGIARAAFLLSATANVVFFYDSHDPVHLVAAFVCFLFADTKRGLLR